MKKICKKNEFMFNQTKYLIVGLESEVCHVLNVKAKPCSEADSFVSCSSTSHKKKISTHKLDINNIKIRILLCVTICKNRHVDFYLQLHILIRIIRFTRSCFHEMDRHDCIGKGFNLGIFRIVQKYDILFIK